MRNDSAIDLRLKFHGLRFASHDTEKKFRDWRIDDAIPFVRFGMIAGLFSEIVILISAFFVVRDQFSQVMVLLICAVTPLAITLVLTSFSAGRRLVFPATVITNIATGLAAVWLFHEVLILPVASTQTPYALVSCLLLMFYAFTIFRLPLMAASLAVLPYLALTLHIIFQDYQHQVVAGSESMTQLVLLFNGLLVGLLICSILSIISRRNFVSHVTVHQQQDLISRYMPPAVSRQILSGNATDIGQPRRQRVTILFADIVGFTDLADRVEPEVMTEVLNQYLSEMVNIIEENGGTLNEFAGDGVMALFGAPDAMPPERQAKSAVHAALEMQGRMVGLNEDWRKLGLGAVLKIRVGINTGMVSVGSYGSQGRMTYTAIGLQTNIASRIESAAEPGEILMSDASYQLIRENVECEPRGEVECKGVHYKVSVYSPSKSIQRCATDAQQIAAGDV